MENVDNVKGEVSGQLDLNLDPSSGFFSTPARNGLIQQLSHLVFFGDGLSIIVGPPGSGKSVIATELQRAFETVPHIANVTLDSETDTGTFLWHSVSGFGLRVDENASIGELITELRHFSQALSGDGKLAVLIVDNAQFLDEQAIGAILSLLQGESRSGAGIRVVFFSEPGLVERVDSLQLVEVSVYDFEIPGFSCDETERFAQHHAASAGIELAEDLNYANLWSSSKGYPAAIVEKVSEGQSSADPVSTLTITDRLSGMPYMHATAVAVLVGVLIWAYFIKTGDEKELVLSVDKHVISADSNQDRVLPVEVEHTGEGQPEKEKIKTIDLIEEVNESAGVAEPGSLLENTTAAQDASAKETQKAIEKIYQSSAEADLEAIDSEVADKGMAEAKERELIRDIESSQANKLADPSIGTHSGVNAYPDIAIQAPTLKEELPTPSPLTPKITESKPGITKDESFLLSLPEDKFVLQVLAASKKKSLKSYIDRQPNKERLFLYRGAKQGKLWYIVVEGPYASKAKALAGRASLPAEMSKAGPWPKSLKSVQSEIDKAKEN